jgi:hypothetical protein
METEALETFLPDWHRHRLEAVARKHADELSWMRGGTGNDSDDVDRLVVNMLRHEFTSYEEEQDLRAYRAACVAIGMRYPWLADECERQIARRLRDDAERKSRLESFEAEERARKLWRHERSVTSAKVVGSLSVGMKVGVRIKGRDRTAVITWMGRSRVEVFYAIKSGAERWVKVYASEVSPLLAEVEVEAARVAQRP